MSHNIKPINNSSEPSAGKSFLPNVMTNQHNVMSDEPTTDSVSDGKGGGVTVACAYVFQATVSPFLGIKLFLLPRLWRRGHHFKTQCLTALILR